MNTVIIIPARYSSKRFPGKPLKPLVGYTGISKTLIHRTWEAASHVQGVEHLVIATDDTRIASEVNSFRGKVLMTSTECKNGTERCYEASAHFKPNPEIIINVQGDSPLTPPEFVTELIQYMKNNPEIQVATPVIRCNGWAYNRLLNDRKEGRVGGTTVVFDRKCRALYFSKNVIPWCDQKFSPEEPTPIFHHVGIYGYRQNALRWYGNNEVGVLEQLEGLEQLRFLEMGIHVQCLEVESKNREFWELNNPSDTKVIENVLAKAKIE